MGEFLRFRRMVTPVLIQLLFWLGVLTAIGGGVVLMITENVPVGLAVVLLGPIAVRVYAELLIVLFRIHSALQRMAQQLERAPAVAGGPGSAPGGGYGGYQGGPRTAPQGPPQEGAPGGPPPQEPGTPPPPGSSHPGG